VSGRLTPAAVERAASDGRLPELVDELGAGDDEARWLARALRVDLALLVDSPDLAFPYLYARCFGLGDENFHAPGHAGLAPSTEVRDAMAARLEDWRHAWTRPGRTWLRALRPPEVPLDAPLVEEYRGELGNGEPRFSPDGSHVGVADLAGGRIAWHRRTGARFERSAARELLGAPPDHRIASSQPGSFVLERPGGLLQVVVAIDGDTTVDRLASLPAGVIVAGGGGRRGVIYRIEPERGRVVWKTETRFWVRALAASPDGRWVIARDGSTLLALDAHTGRRTVEIADPGESGAAVSPCSRWLATRRHDVLRVWDLAALIAGHARPALGADDSFVQFCPTGRRLVTGRLLCDAVRGYPMAWLTPAEEPHDGGRLRRRLAYGRYLEAGPAGLRVWDTVIGTLDSTDPAQAATGATMVFDPRGRRYAHVARRGDPVTLIGVDDGRPIARFDIPATAPPEISPFGAWIAIGAADGRVMIASLLDLVPTLVGQHPHEVVCVRFSDDERHLVSIDVDSLVRLWDIAGRRLVAERTLPDGEGRRLLFVSPRKLSTLHGWAGFRLHDHPWRAELRAGIATLYDERDGRAIARIPSTSDLVADDNGAYWASATAHFALCGLDVA